MHILLQLLHDPSTYEGELYLELHRGTLTNQHAIKRNNRLAEIALHDLEFLTVANAVERKEAATDAAYRDLQGELLVNQFHDILPGTCIPRAHDCLLYTSSGDWRGQCPGGAEGRGRDLTPGTGAKGAGSMRKFRKMSKEPPGRYGLFGELLVYKRLPASWKMGIGDGNEETGNG